MKKLEVVVHPKQLDIVKDALVKAGVDSVTMSDVKSCRGEGHAEMYRDALYVVDFLPRIKIEVVLDDAFAARVAALIDSNVAAGVGSDDGVHLLPVDDAFRIGFERRGDAAP